MRKAMDITVHCPFDGKPVCVEVQVISTTQFDIQGKHATSECPHDIDDLEMDEGFIAMVWKAIEWKWDEEVDRWHDREVM